MPLPEGFGCANLQKAGISQHGSNLDAVHRQPCYIRTLALNRLPSVRPLPPMLPAALLWIAIQADLVAPDLATCRGWSIAPIASAALQPLFTYPDYHGGLKLN